MDNLKNLELVRELDMLEKEHKQLDSLLGNSNLDQITTQRIKKRKLWIKDRLSAIRSLTRPDIIA